MKKYARILVATTFLLGLGATAQAATRDDIVVTVPFAFLVGGKSLPAGTYTVSHLSDDRRGPLMLTSRDNGTSVFVLPYVSESTSADKPEVDFQRVGEQHLLSTIQTALDIFQIPVSRSVVMQATARSGDKGSASGNSGGD
jgi:hypothetical protein